MMKKASRERANPLLARGAGVVVGAGTVLSVFGVVTPAAAATDCSTVTPIAATELALRTALEAGDELICINPGTINLGTTGTDGDDSIIEVDSDVTIVGIGNVVFDGTGSAPGAFVAERESDVDLHVESITFQNFVGMVDEIPAVVGSTTSGSITVVESTFEGNFGYAMVGGIDAQGTVQNGDYADITVTDSVFVNNSVVHGAVWGSGDITISHSTFENNSSIDATVAYLDFDDDRAFPVLTMDGNYVYDNDSISSSMIVARGGTAIFVNNTFDSNDYFGPGIEYLGETNGYLAFNTFVDGFSESLNPNLRVGEDAVVGIMGNIFKVGPEEFGVDEDPGSLTDLGGNFSTADDAQYLTDPTSYSLVDVEDLALAVDAADNGGLTYTFALGANSIARDAVPAERVVEEFGESIVVDQRGGSRGELLDAGAFEFDEVLASTGVDATGILITGTLLGIAGAAVVARRPTAIGKASL